jgi:hypothetical protein
VFGRRRRQLQAAQEAEEIAAKQILRAVSTVTFPGDVVTPDDVARAAKMVSMEVVQGAMQGGASPRDCSALMEMYAHVGHRVGSMFAPGGPMHGATASGLEDS